MVSENPFIKKREAYPERLLEEIKSEFGSSEELNKALEGGHKTLERFLFNRKDFLMAAEEIIKAFKENESLKVLEAAQRSNRISKLYAELLEFQKK